MRTPKATRKVTAYNACTDNKPELRITGHYLKTICGFLIGETVAVEYGRGMITIRSLTPAPAINDAADSGRECLAELAA